ncbi:MAG: ABC transporter substrate-binding protein, partial [Kineothrix sp.]|nr:ABC transporter substrate-binding protein [Kineothrix sp.]
IAAYEKEHPNITIEYQQVNFGTDLETKLNTLYAGGSAPDLVRAPISTIALRASMGQYAALDEFIEGWPEKDNYMENAYEIGSYQGKQYGLPIVIDAQVFFYRKDYFEEAGLDPDSPPETWEELLEYAEKLTVWEGNDVVRAGFAFPISGEHQTLIPFARQNGSLVVDEENNKPTFNDDKTIETLEYLAKYGEKNLVIPYIRNKDQNPFLLGNAAMTYAGVGNYTALKADGVEWIDQLGFSCGVGREKISTFGGAQIMFISEESKHKEEAWKFMEYLFADESVGKLIEETGATAVKLSLSEKYIETYPEIGPAFLETLSHTQGMPKVEWAPAFEEAVKLAFEEAMYGKKDAKTALDDAYNQLLSEIE